MKPGCPKCFKVAEKNGNEYICPSCGDVVAQIPATLSIEEQNELLKKVAESYARIINDLEEDCERYFDQRNKLIEGLRKLYRIMKTDHDEAHEAEAYDVCDLLEEPLEIVQNILHEIGVTVEWQKSANDMRTTR